MNISLEDLTEEQRAAYDEALEYLNDPFTDKPYWSLEGLAGTGKTTVLAALAQVCPRAILCAFTGKAASVLRGKTGLDVSTCHSVVYNFSGHEDDEDGKKQPIFVSKKADYSGTAIFVDEKSTVGSRLGQDLLATRAKIIACGDPGQLPPVKDTPFFEDCDRVLRTVHRQAWDSAIIRQAHAVRSGQRYRSDGDEFHVMHREDMSPDDIMFGGIALCYRNVTRRRLNVSRRRGHGITGKVLRAGEPIMVLKNDHALGVYNGAIYEVARDREPYENLEIIESGGKHITLFNATVEMIDAEFDANKFDEAFSPVALAYATTGHKFQGSEEDEVLLIDEYNKDYQRNEWLYTCFTRAAKRILVVRT